ncbi:MAG: hypothetical protein JWL68_710 [Actinomycetia bacterium]|nr:hypothetical protein [Actinomycetes bacterium]
MISGPISLATPGITPGSGNVRSLVLRAWVEPGASPGLRARVVEIAAGRDERPVLVTTSVDEACHAVRNWLKALEAGGINDSGDGTVTGRR